MAVAGFDAGGDSVGFGESFARARKPDEVGLSCTPDRVGFGDTLAGAIDSGAELTGAGV